MGILIVNSDFERIWNEPMPSISFDNATYSLAGEVGTTLSASFAIFDNYDADVTDQCEITLDNDNVSIEDGMFVCDDLEVGTYQTIATATYSYKSATVTATATINISVEEEKPTSISFDSNSYSLSGTEGETITESFSVTDNLSNDVTALCSYAFSPNDTGITASNGTFDASSVLAGTYSVTVTATYGELTTTATISIEVQSASHDYSKEYFTTEALESGTFTLTVPANVDSSKMTSVSYSTDDGANWTTTTIDNTAQTITTPTINDGDKVLWKGVGDSLSGSSFSSTGNFNASGNIMSLLYGDNFVGQTSFVEESACYRLFMNNTKIVSAENMILPATTLKSFCYQQMFLNCSSLTTAPALPATNLGDSRVLNVYANMFQNCTSLTTAPTLPATTLVNSCYKNMFNGCTSLTTAPTLPATTLADYCYQGMFMGCTSLTTLPSDLLPATTLANYCYNSMFYGCTSLTTAPELPATTLAQYCYGGHSGGMTTNYEGMFQNCTSLTTAPTLSATTLVNSCYDGMFYGCTNLNNITMLATDISATSCLFNWVNGVQTTSGTFTKAASMTTLPTGTSGIPANWTVVDAS